MRGTLLIKKILIKWKKYAPKAKVGIKTLKNIICGICILSVSLWKSLVCKLDGKLTQLEKIVNQY